MKSISLAQQDAMSAAVVRPVAFVEVDWLSGTQRYCTAGAPMSWSGQDWMALGNLVAISEIEETEAVAATGIALTLSGVPTSLLSLALSEHIQGRPLRIWVAPTNENYALIGEPVLEYVGRCDVLTHDLTEDGVASLTLSVESRMASLLGAAVRRYTDEDQKAEFPGDDFFRFVPQMAERLIVFPSAQAQGRR